MCIPNLLSQAVTYTISDFTKEELLKACRVRGLPTRGDKKDLVGVLNAVPDGPHVRTKPQKKQHPAFERHLLNADGSKVNTVSDCLLDLILASAI